MSKQSMQQNLTNALRFLAIDMIEHAKSGHPGMPMGMADVITVLFKSFLNFNPQDPIWPNRDRFVLSAGHGSALLYAVLFLTGYKKINIKELKKFRQLGAKTHGHPEFDLKCGIETTTGPLGQGIANAVGMALSERMLNCRFGDNLINHKVYVVAGDGCLMEGISQEAISLAGHLVLNNLIILFDDNQISIDGSVSLTTSDDTIQRFQASKWNTETINGHDHEEIYQALLRAQYSDKPVLIACNTKIGHGAPNKEGLAIAHGTPLGAEEIALVRQKFNWHHSAFKIPKNILLSWRGFANRSNKKYADWQLQEKTDFNKFTNKSINIDLLINLDEFKKNTTKLNKLQSTRKSSKDVLNIIYSFLPNLVGGSADLTTSNCTKIDTQIAITSNSYYGNYIHYGVREHAMAGIMNGISVYSAFRPYGGTFLVFSDYCRPAIRLAAMMKQPVIFIMTHDSIGIGEDGPTHQPIEQLASLRAIPNLIVMRPCDIIETIECWEIILQTLDKPGILALSRQDLPQIRSVYSKQNLCQFGAYIILQANAAHRVNIFASGSEVHIAIAAALKLELMNIGVNVISAPCKELLFQQNSKYMKQILKNDIVNVAIEAGLELGWEKIIGSNGLFIGLKTFGKSGRQEELYEYFGINTENIVKKIILKLTPET